MPSKSKTKGSNFERSVAKFLSNLFDDNFLRVPASGAFTGGKNVHRLDEMTDMQRRVFQGDIIPGSILGNTKFECKSYASIPWHQLMQNSCKLVDKWIEQAEDSIVPWYLIFKGNNIGSYVLVPLDIADRFHYPTQLAVLTYKQFTISSFEQTFTINKQKIIDLNDLDSFVMPANL